MVKLSSGRPAGARASPSTPPPKHSRPLEGMLHRTAALAGFQARGLELVIPLGGSVGVIQQHQGRLVAEAERLTLHDALVLVEEMAGDQGEQGGGPRHPPGTGSGRAADET